MIRHVILFKFYATATQTERDAAVRALRELGKTIPEVLEWSVGVRLDGAPVKHYDVAQISSFENIAVLARFREHPEHIRVRDVLSKIADWVVVDYET